MRDNTLKEFYESQEAKERMDSKEVIALEGLLRKNPDISMESVFLDFLRHFHSAALIARKKEDSDALEAVSFAQIQSVFQDLLLAKRRVEKADFESWISEPAYEKEEK